MDRLHRPLADPARAEGCDGEILARFCEVRDEIRRRIVARLGEENLPAA